MPAGIEPIYDVLGGLVRQRRISLGWSQERLGRALKPAMTRASIANIEAGKQRVLLHTALELASILQFRLDDLSAGGDTQALAAQLASRLPIPSSRARSLATTIYREEDQKNP